VMDYGGGLEQNVLGWESRRGYSGGKKWKP